MPFNYNNLFLPQAFHTEKYVSKVSICHPFHSEMSNSLYFQILAYLPSVCAVESLASHHHISVMCHIVHTLLGQLQQDKQGRNRNKNFVKFIKQMLQVCICSEYKWKYIVRFRILHLN